jgi:hypothetical protein
MSLNQCISLLKLWFRIMPRRGVLDAILYNKGRQFFPSTPVSSTNKIGSHDIAEIAEIWLKVALNTIPISHIRTNNIFRTSTLWERMVSSCTYGSGIYIYICTHCRSMFRLWVRFLHMVRCTRYILYNEAIAIKLDIELLPVFWHVAQQKRGNNFEFWSNSN